jgi:hypothetical protein
MRLSASRRRIKLQATRITPFIHLQRILQVLVNLHDSSLVTTSIAVIRCTEDSHDVSLLTPIVPLHDQLMGSADERKAVVMVEGFRDILPERVSGSARGDAPAASVVWVRPE